MVRAIIFDCFGVLVSDGWLPFKKKYFSQNKALHETATDINKQVNAGLADYDSFIEQVAKLAGIETSDARKQIEDNPAQEDLFTYITDILKPKYKIGILSNAGANWLGELFSQQQLELFDAIALSYETGAVKPDIRAYAIIAERLGVEPENCVFVDDQPRYCQAAEAVGMKSIHFKDFDSFKVELEVLLADSNR